MQAGRRLRQGPALQRALAAANPPPQGPLDELFQLLAAKYAPLALEVDQATTPAEPAKPDEPPIQCPDDAELTGREGVELYCRKINADMVLKTRKALSASDTPARRSIFPRFS